MNVSGSIYRLDQSHPLYDLFTQSQVERDRAIQAQVDAYHQQSRYRLDQSHPLYDLFTQSQVERDRAIQAQVDAYHQQSRHFLETANIINGLVAVELFVCRWKEATYDEYDRSLYPSCNIWEDQAEAQAFENKAKRREFTLTKERFFKDAEGFYYSIEIKPSGFQKTKILVFRKNIEHPY